jgi:hypothetical protein
MGIVTIILGDLEIERSFINRLESDKEMHITNQQRVA